MTDISYVQTFKSIQGEGLLTGQPSLWLRTTHCNLSCDGFGQDDPTSPDTYDLPYKQIDVTDITDYTDLPVFSKGCDSSYAWHKGFNKFFKTMSVEDTLKHLDDMLPTPGVWDCPAYDFDMVFTGGEPLLKRNQAALAEMINEWNARTPSSSPRGITFETNGTQEITDVLADALNASKSEILFSISPKLFTVSGEANKKAIRPDKIKQMLESCWHGIYTLKFVMTPDPIAWVELEDVINDIGLSRKNVWIMPVGGTLEGQEITAGAVADMAIERGYKVSARVHVNLWDNDLDK